MRTLRHLFYIAAAVASWSAIAGTKPAAAHDLEGLLHERDYSPDLQKALEHYREWRKLLGPARDGTSKLLSGDNAAIADDLSRHQQSEEALESIYDYRALWPANYTLRICFFQGDASARTALLKIVEEVASYTSLKVSPDTPDCDSIQFFDIRVTFRTKGYWSHVGTEAMTLLPQNAPTMGLMGFDRADYSNPEVARIVRHEVMHAVGSLHEHQHPDSGCEATLDRTYLRRYAAAHDWTEADIDNNFKQFVWNDYIDGNSLHHDIRGAAYDLKSIMHYQLTPELFVGGTSNKCYLSMANDVLSEDDKVILKAMYPTR